MGHLFRSHTRNFRTNIDFKEFTQVRDTSGHHSLLKKIGFSWLYKPNAFYSYLVFPFPLRFPSLFVVRHQRKARWLAPAGLACLLFCILPALPSGQTSVIWRTEWQIYYKEWRALGIVNPVPEPIPKF
jgi:hypothetical protein